MGDVIDFNKRRNGGDPGGLGLLECEDCGNKTWLAVFDAGQSEESTIDLSLVCTACGWTDGELVAFTLDNHDGDE